MLVACIVWVRIKLLKKIIALIIANNEGGEIHHVNFAHGLHAQFREVNNLDILYVILRENRRWPSDRTEIETAMLVT